MSDDRATPPVDASDGTAGTHGLEVPAGPWIEAPLAVLMQQGYRSPVPDVDGSCTACSCWLGAHGLAVDMHAATIEVLSGGKALPAQLRCDACLLICADIRLLL